MAGPVDPYYRKNVPHQMTLAAGDAVIIDTRVMHRGGANMSEELRMLFHFSFETLKEDHSPFGFTYNLAPELKGQHSLANLQG